MQMTVATGTKLYPIHIFVKKTVSLVNSYLSSFYSTNVTNMYGIE